LRRVEFFKIGKRDFTFIREMRVYGSSFWFDPLLTRIDIESFWTEDYAGQIPNNGRELAIYVLQL
jgi:hypothetical protein